MTREHFTNDRGSVTPWFIMIVTIAFLLVGVSVDTSGKLQAANHAETVAGEAARAGANALDYTPSKIGDIHLAYHRSQAAAEHYLSAAGLTGQVTINGREVSVTTHDTYTPLFLSAIGIGPVTVTGQATAQLVAPGE